MRDSSFKKRVDYRKAVAAFGQYGRADGGDEQGFKEVAERLRHQERAGAG